LSRAPKRRSRGKAGFRVEVSDRQRCLRLDASRLSRDLGRVLAAVGFPGDLSLSLVEDAEMGDLHGRFSGDPTPTDVLAFPLEDPGGAGPRGEVILSVETAVREAKARGLLPRGEVLLYAVHGILHLCGEDDHDPVKARRMDRRTLALLRNLGYLHRMER
jgi:probable rRNA maturation factor